MRIEFPADPQQYIVYPVTWPRLRLERLPAVAALGGDVGLLHVDIVEVKVPINSNHGVPPAGVLDSATQPKQGNFPRRFAKDQAAK